MRVCHYVRQLIGLNHYLITLIRVGDGMGISHELDATYVVNLKCYVGQPTRTFMRLELSTSPVCLQCHQFSPFIIHYLLVLQLVMSSPHSLCIIFFDFKLTYMLLSSSIIYYPIRLSICYTFFLLHSVLRSTTAAM